MSNPHPHHSNEWFKFEFVVRGGRGVCRWTEEERKVLFGDCNPNRDIEKYNSYNDALIKRYQAGLPLSKEDKRTARRLLKSQTPA